MNDLTEQWGKGELPCGWYYIKIADIVFIDFFEGKVWKNKKDEYIDEVLAPVPSYDEWKEYQELDEDNKRNTQLAIQFSIEADILKELLKQSRIYVKIETEDYDDRTVSKADKEEAKKLLTKIDEVLK
jgi:hypothetical protein